MTADVEIVIPQVWTDALTYAVRKNKGQLKVSSLKNHVDGVPDADAARQVLEAMRRAGYVSNPEKVHQCYVWTVTALGREAVE